MHTHTCWRRLIKSKGFIKYFNLNWLFLLKVFVLHYLSYHLQFSLFIHCILLYCSYLLNHIYSFRKGSLIKLLCFLILSLNLNLQRWLLMKMLHSIFVNVLCKLICIFYGSEINLKLKKIKLKNIKGVAVYK